MDSFVLAFFSVIALVLLIVAFFKKQVVLAFFSGVLFLLVGVGLWTGISFLNTVIVSNSTAVNGYTYSTFEVILSNTYTTASAILFSLFGSTIIFISFIAMTVSKKVPLYDYFEGSSDE